MEECAVCDTELATGEPYETDYLDEDERPLRTTHDGMTYYFCSEEHMETFEENPEQFVS